MESSDSRGDKAAHLRPAVDVDRKPVESREGPATARILYLRRPAPAPHTPDDDPGPRAA